MSIGRRTFLSFLAMLPGLRWLQPLPEQTVSFTFAHTIVSDQLLIVECTRDHITYYDADWNRLGQFKTSKHADRL